MPRKRRPAPANPRALAGGALTCWRRSQWEAATAAIRRFVGRVGLARRRGMPPGWPWGDTSRPVSCPQGGCIGWQDAQCVSARWSASARVAGGRGLLPGERDPKRCVRVGWSASPSAVGDSVLPSRGARSEAVRLCRVERLTIDRRTIHESPLSREIRAVRRRASPLLTVARRLCRGVPSFTRRSRLRCAHPPSAVSRAMGASSTTSRSPANPYQCLVPGFALANLVSGLAHTTISDRSTRADHPGVRIKSRICEKF